MGRAFQCHPEHRRGRTLKRGVCAASGPLLLAFLLSLRPRAVAAEKTDIIVLTNGDRVTGEIRSLSNGLLTYKTDDMGTLSVEWERIQRISSSWPFILEDLVGRRYTGALHETPNDGEVMVLQESGPVTLKLADIIGIARFGKRLSQRFQGYLDLGFSLQKAQKYTQLNVASNLSYLSQRWDIKLDASSYFTSQENVEDIKKNLLGIKAMRLFRKRWMTFIPASRSEVRMRPWASYILENLRTVYAQRPYSHSSNRHLRPGPPFDNDD